jgi:hypothetical protein
MKGAINGKNRMSKLQVEECSNKAVGRKMVPEMWRAVEAKEREKEMFKLILFIFLMLPTLSFAYTNDQIANAIFKAENSKVHPYGIMVKYRVTTPRQACLNTIAHAKRDWNGKGDFIAFLGKRYAPVGASNDLRGLNRNWIKNVKHFLEAQNG